MNSMISALVRTGVAITTRTLVTRTVQTRIGIRNRVIPGARILKIVTRKLIPPRIELVPISSTAMIHRSWLGQVGPDGQGEQAADEEEQERVDEVQNPDLLVIGRRQPLIQAAPVGGGGGRQRRGRHRSSLTGP